MFMQRNRAGRRRGIVCAFAIGSALTCAPLALAQDDGGNAGEQTERKTLIAFEFEGFASMAPDDRDSGLRKAISMLPARFKELKSLPDAPPELQRVPDRLIDLVWSRLSSPVRMIATHSGTDPQTGMPRVGAVLSFGVENEAEANALHEQVNAMRMMGGDMPVKESSRFDSMMEMPIPMLGQSVTFGPRRAEDGWRYEVLFGAFPDPDEAFDAMPTTRAGVDRVLSFELDFANISPLVEQNLGFLMMAPGGAEMMKQLREQGIVGNEAMSIEYTMGYSDTHAVTSLRAERAGRYADALGISRTPLTRADLAALPSDTIAAYVVKGDFTAGIERTLEQFRSMPGPFAMEIDGLLGSFKEQTGVDLMTDVVGPLGDTTALYISDSTGGNSLMSATLMLGLDDAERFGEALGRLSTQGNALAKNIPSELVSVKLQRSEQGGTDFTQLQVRGLPIPLEPTFAVTPSWLVLGASPQGCSAAVHQTKDRAIRGLNANEAFAGEFAGVEDPVSVTFVDMERTIVDGYSTAQLLTSALTNFVRSPRSDNGPGTILPTLGELRRDVRPLLSVGYWDGEDYIYRQTSDRSLIANMAGGLGIADIGDTLVTLTAIGSVAFPAMNDAREAAERAHSHHAHPPQREEPAF